MQNGFEDNRFTYNDGVIVKKGAPEKFHPGEDGVICGMNKVITKQGAEEYSSGVDEWVYIVEFSDGSSIEIAECYLEADPGCLKYCLRERVIMKRGIPDKYHPSEVVSILGYHDISQEFLADEFNLKLGDVVYIVKSEDDDEFLVSEAFIEKRWIIDRGIR